MSATTARDIPHLSTRDAAAALGVSERTIQRRRKGTRPNRVPFSMRLDPAVLARASERAQAAGITLTSYIEAAIRRVNAGE